MDTVQSATYVGGNVLLDGKRFIDCTFKGTTLDYNGGVCQLQDCTFDSIKLMLGGDLGNGLEFLRVFHQQQGPKGVKRVVDFLSGFMRRKDPPQTFTIG